MGTVGIATSERCPAGEIIGAFRQTAGCTKRKPLRQDFTNNSPEHVLREFFTEELTVVVDAGRCEIGLESTIVSRLMKVIELHNPAAGLCNFGNDRDRQQVLRPESIDDNKTIEAPGMMASHYAPNAELLLNQESCPQGAALLAFGDGCNRDRSHGGEIFNLSPGGNLNEAAANLYAGMTSLDSTGHKVIAVEPIPNTGIGIAINDRLMRAAAPKPEDHS